MLGKSREPGIMIVLGFLAVTALLIAPVGATGTGNTWIALRYRFRPGERVEYAVTRTESITTVVSTGRGRKELTSNTTTKMNFMYDVLDVDTQRTATVKLTVDEIRIEGEKMGQSGSIRANAAGVKSYLGGQLVFDSSQMPGVDQSVISEMLDLGEIPEGMELGVLFGKGITVQIPRLGYMDVPEIGLEGSQQYLGILEPFEPDPLPRKLVRPGDTWRTDMKGPRLNKETVEAYGLRVPSTFEGIEEFQGRRCAKIVSRMERDLSKDPNALPPMPGVKVFRSRGESTSYFDIEEGRLLKMVGEFSRKIQAMQSVDLQALGMEAESGSATAEVSSSSKLVIEIELKR